MCRKATLPGFGSARAWTEITRIEQSYQEPEDASMTIV